MRAEDQSSERTENCLLAAACRSKLEKCSLVLWLLAAYGRDCVRMCACVCGCAGVCVVCVSLACSIYALIYGIMLKSRSHTARAAVAGSHGTELGSGWSGLGWSGFGCGSWFALGRLSLQTLLLLLR